MRFDVNHTPERGLIGAFALFRSDAVYFCHDPETHALRAPLISLLGPCAAGEWLGLGGSIGEAFHDGRTGRTALRPSRSSRRAQCARQRPVTELRRPATPPARRRRGRARVDRGSKAEPPSRARPAARSSSRERRGAASRRPARPAIGSASSSLATPAFESDVSAFAGTSCSVATTSAPHPTGSTHGESARSGSKAPIRTGRGPRTRTRTSPRPSCLRCSPGPGSSS